MPSKKPALLFVHGFRGNHLGLEETVKYFEEKGYKCYAPDIPPAFNTKKEKLPELKSFDADGYAKWIADYILDNKIDKPVLIGHSMGSIICAATAERYPELVNEKIFFLSPICVKPPKFICNLAPLVTIVPNKFIGYVTTKYLLIRKEMLKPVLGITYKCAEKFTSKKETGNAARFSIEYAIDDFNFERECYFIAGEKDKLNSQKDIKRVAKKFNGNVEFLKNSGHLINYECPFELAKAIEKGF